MKRNGKGIEEEEERKRKGKREKNKRKTKGKQKEEERKSKGRKERGRGSICGDFFEQMGIAMVSQGVSGISPLPWTQLCANQLQVRTLYTIMGIAFWGGRLLHSVWCTFQLPREHSLSEVKCDHFDHTSYAM